LLQNSAENRFKHIKNFDEDYKKVIKYYNFEENDMLNSFSLLGLGTSVNHSQPFSSIHPLPILSLLVSFLSVSEKPSNH
jgi:hypothetical protein